MSEKTRMSEGTTSAMTLEVAPSVEVCHTARSAPFGSRYLTEDQDVWSHNAWDHVPPPEDQEERISASLARQHLSPVADADRKVYNTRPYRFWNQFYKTNTVNFFRDRKWLNHEFPELVDAMRGDAGPRIVLEVGCGVGNTAFPLLRENENPEFQLFACDYSPHAISLVQTDPLYCNPQKGSIHASVWDLSSDNLPENLEESKVDIIVLIFVLSALHPGEWSSALRNLHRLLKPGGLVLFRDYGRHDLAQLRFKEGRLLEDNFYIRGDKTRVYFFSEDDVRRLFSGQSVSEGDGHDRSRDASRRPPFDIEFFGVDQRLIVNRKRQLKMYRVWVQGKFRKR